MELKDEYLTITDKTSEGFIARNEASFSLLPFMLLPKKR